MQKCKNAKQKLLEQCVHEMLLILGHKPLREREMFAQTPRRVAQYLLEFHQSFKAEQVLGACFSADNCSNSLVAQTKIPFRGMCAHHLLPFTGQAAIGYIADSKIVGLSKLARLVKAVGLKAPGIQEGMTDEIANLMAQVLKPRGVIVVIEAEHTCMTCRGVATPGVSTITSAVRGVFRDVPAARQEFFSLLNRK